MPKFPTTITREKKVFPVACDIIMEKLLAAGKLTLPAPKPQGLTKVNICKSFVHSIEIRA